MLDTDDSRRENVTEQALNLLFKVEHSKVYQEDLDLPQVSESQESELENEEGEIYNEMH